MQQNINNLTLVSTTSKTLPMAERLARIFAAVTSCKGESWLPWKSCDQDLICRYLVSPLNSDRINVDIVHKKNDEIVVSISNADRWQVFHDEIMPEFGFVIAQAMIDAGCDVTFKQESLQKLEAKSC